MQNRKINRKNSSTGQSKSAAAQAYAVLNPERMEQLRLQEGMSVGQFATLVGVSAHTAARFFRRLPVQWAVVRKISANLGIADMQPYLATPGDHDTLGLDEIDAEVLAEWQVENVFTQPTTLSNGLVFRVCKLKHKLLSNVFGRGKCYDLASLRTRDESRVHEQLLRHPVVCRSVAPCPSIPVNERVLYSQDRSRFWVIDRWCDGITLADKFLYGPLPPHRLPVVMQQIMLGVAALHDAGIIRRELSPEYLTLVEPNGDVLLTELELSKLLEGAISVAQDWQPDCYRAPEVEAAEIDATVDFYSWAQILIHAATGQIPPQPADPKLLKEMDLPSAVRSIAERCLSASHRWRPRSAAEILKPLAAWATTRGEGPA